MLKEGNKTYQYGWLDKVMSITQNGKITANYDYHISGQIATASIRTGNSPVITQYEWDGLALIKRGPTNLTNEPAVTGGNPILADNNVLFNDMLGTTIGIAGSNGEKSFAPTATTAFGESITNNDQRKTNSELFFTGKPNIKGLGYAFLFRNYRANLGKWQTADPLGYPDGWNNLAYGNNQVTMGVDSQGTVWVAKTHTIDLSVSATATVADPVVTETSAIISIILETWLANIMGFTQLHFGTVSVTARLPSHDHQEGENCYITESKKYVLSWEEETTTDSEGNTVTNYRNQQAPLLQYLVSQSICTE